MRRLTAVAIAAIIFTGCSISFGGGKLDTEKLQTEIKSGIEAQTGVTLIGVTCPQDIEIEQGNTFTCTAVDTNGETGTVTVTQDDDEGNVSWEIKPN